MANETFWDIHGDPRIKDRFLMTSPLPVVAFSVAYVLFTKFIGHKLMDGRKALNLRKTLVVYNLFHVLYNLWLFLEGAKIVLDGVSLRCEPMDHSTSEKQMHLIKLCYWYFILKLLEFGDGFFFILRKKFNQTSNLHVIHHSIMPISVWIGVKFLPHAQGAFFGWLNVLVHVFMYGYYLVSSLGVKNAIKWKRFVTIIQLTQFLAIVVHSLQIFFTDCDFPRGCSAFIGLHAILFFFAFKQFYNNAYKSKGLKNE